MGSVVGYALIHAIAAGIAQIRRHAIPSAMVDGFAGAAFDTPFGRAAFRAIDHQSTLGAFVGKTRAQGRARRDGGLALRRRRRRSCRRTTRCGSMRPAAG